MKLANLSFVVLTMLFVTFSSCKKDKVEETETTELPPPNASSTLNVTFDNKTYNLKVMGQTFSLADTAKLKIDATAPEITLRLRANSAQHVGGVGNYFLHCCSNDIYDKTTNIKKHWMTDQRGTTQDGIIEITRIDQKGYEGTFIIKGYDPLVSISLKKEFKGNFVIVY